MPTNYTCGHVCRYACTHACMYTQREREREWETNMPLILTALPIGSWTDLKMIFKNRHTIVKTNIQLGEGILFCQNQSPGILFSSRLVWMSFVSCGEVARRQISDGSRIHLLCLFGAAASSRRGALPFVSSVKSLHSAQIPALWSVLNIKNRDPRKGLRLHVTE